MIEISSTSLAESFAWCILQVTLFAAAALLIYSLVRRQRSDHNVVLLAVSLATVGLMTLAFLSPWPRWELDRASPTRSARLPKPIAHLVGSPRNNAPTPGGTPGASSDGRGLQEIAPSHPSLPLPNLDLYAPPTEPLFTAINPQWWRWAVGAAWLLGMIGIARFLIGLAYVHRYRRQSIPIDDDQLRDEFGAIARKLQLVAPVALVEVPSLTVAATIGWRRPLVILPASWREWSANERRAVLAHELAHVAKRHFPLWLIGQLAVATHFYHPLVHWLGRRLRLEQELAADECAVRLFGNRQAYAHALAGLALGAHQDATTHASLGLFISRPLLMRRIAMLRQSNSATRRPARLVGSLSLTLLVLAMLTSLGLRATPQSAAADESPNLMPAPKSGIETVNSTTALLQVSGEPKIVQVRALAALLKSVPVIQPTLRKPEIAHLPIVKAQNDPLQWVIDHLDVGFFPDSDVVYVRMKNAGQDTEQLRTLVDAVVRESSNVGAVYDRESRSNEREALSQNLDKMNAEIRERIEKRNVMGEKQRNSTTGDHAPQRELLLQQLAQIEKTKAEVESQLARRQAEFMDYEQRMKGPDPGSIDARVDEYLATDPDLALMKTELVTLQYQLNAVKDTTSSDDSGELSRLEQLIHAKQLEIAQHQAQVRILLQAGDTKESYEMLQIRKEFQVRSGLLQQQLLALNKSIQAKSGKLALLQSKSVEEDVLNKELHELQEQAADLSMKLERMDVEAIAPPRVRVIQWAM